MYKELLKIAQEREILIDDNGMKYYIVNGEKIYQMEIKSEHDKKISDNIAAMRFGCFKSGFDMMK